MPRKRRRREKILILWNFVGEDEYRALADKGPQPLPWAPDKTATEVSTVSEEIEAIEEAVREAGFPARVVNIEESFEKLVDAIRDYQPAAIFNLIEFFNDVAVQEANVAGLYEMMKVPFTGAGPLCLLTCQRKFRTKVLLDWQGVPTPPYQRYTDTKVPKDHGLKYPLIVKPSREDASGGIHADAVVHDYDALVARVAAVLEDHQQPALVERYIPGREIHVAILGNSPPEALPLLEFEFDDAEPPEDDQPQRPQILTYEAKWDPMSKDFYSLDVQVPAKIPRRIGKRIEQAALAAYKITGCRDYARVDLRVDEDGNPYVLEVNPNPDLAEGVGFMLCAEKSGRTFESTIAELVEMALARRPPKERKPRAPKAKKDKDGKDGKDAKPAKAKAPKDKAAKPKGKAKDKPATPSRARRTTERGAPRAQ